MPVSHMFFVLTDYLVFILINEFKDNIWNIGLKLLYLNLQPTIDNNLLDL